MNLMNQYYVFLEFLPLPVAPEKIEITVPNLNKTITLVDMGEVNIVRGEGLKEISFDMLLPSFNYPFATYSLGSFSISQSLGYLEYLKQTGSIAHFIVTRCRKGIPSWWTNIRVTVEDFKVIEDANNGTDVIVSINLKEHREYKTKLAKVKKDEKGTLTATFDNPRPITGNIAPFFYNLRSIKDKTGTTISVVDLPAGTTLYNESKKIDGKGSRDVINTLKKANPNIKNTVAQKTTVKVPQDMSWYNKPTSTGVNTPTTQASWMKQLKPTYSPVFERPTVTTISAAKSPYTYMDRFGNINPTARTTYISAAKQSEISWDRYGNIQRGK